MQAITLQNEFRFGGIERLYGKGSLERLRAAHVIIVGIGGVGSWVAESLARSAVGELTLVDLDDICEQHQQANPRLGRDGRKTESRRHGGPLPSH